MFHKWLLKREILSTDPEDGLHPQLPRQIERLGHCFELFPGRLLDEDALGQPLLRSKIFEFARIVDPVRARCGGG